MRSSLSRHDFMASVSSVAAAGALSTIDLPALHGAAPRSKVFIVSTSDRRKSVSELIRLMKSRRRAALACFLSVASAVPALVGAQPAPAAVPGGPATRVLIAYLSKTGHTEMMARAVAEGAKSSARTTVVLKRIAEVTDDDLLGADAIVVGTPVYNGGVAADVKQFIERWPFGRLKDKVGAAFCTSGGTSAGEELALMDIISSMLVFQFVIVGGDSWEAAFGASAVARGGTPKDRPDVDGAALAKARGLGARVAAVAGKLVAAAVPAKGQTR